MPHPGRRPERPPPHPEPSLAGQARRGFDGLLVLVGAVVLLAWLLGLSADSRPRPRPVALTPVAPVAQVAETERDGVLKVQVVSKEGQPLADAHVRLLWERAQRYFDAGHGSTDDAGWVTLQRVPRGAVWVLADAPGRARASTQLVVEGGARDVKLVLGVATPLRVTVTDEAHVPLADATLTPARCRRARSTLG